MIGLGIIIQLMGIEPADPMSARWPAMRAACGSFA
ncbi:MAG: hypothetical protein N838_29055 [Thiohalocapsa sp. PB-PSB1]|nr:MAG: hypothetical protein N838_29055 [Thiohalocapsa sp. PB-PSB1]